MTQKLRNFTRHMAILLRSCFYDRSELDLNRYVAFFHLINSLDLGGTAELGMCIYVAFLANLFYNTCSRFRCRSHVQVNSLKPEKSKPLLSIPE